MSFDDWISGTVSRDSVASARDTQRRRRSRSDPVYAADRRMPVRSERGELCYVGLSRLAKFSAAVLAGRNLLHFRHELLKIPVPTNWY